MTLQEAAKQAQEQAYRQQAEYAKEPAQQPIGAALGGCATPYGELASRDSLLSRLYRQVSHAQQEALRAQRTQELIGLLEKNPEVARMLDLLEEIGR